MHQRSVVLINENRMRPPVAPLALDYLGGRLRAAGVPVRLVDLCFASDPAAEIQQAVADNPVAVGISFRNTDDCYLASGAWFVPRLTELVAQVRQASTAPVVIGGCGFSIFPAEVLDCCGADLAIAGDGEEPFLQLITHLAAERDYRHVPGLVFRGPDGQTHINPVTGGSDLDVPPHRDLIDNARYFREGGMGNVETKRGCPQACIYCADPVAKGRTVRCRPPQQVAHEVENLLRQGVDVLHLCDGEFNIPPAHALAVCESLIARGLGERVRWYAYATVHPFPQELAHACRQAGCVGINFGVDSGSARMLAALRRGYAPEHIRQTVEHCRAAGIAVMLDLLIGAPGEDEATVRESIDFLKGLNPDRVGAATGVRLYPRTALADAIRRSGPLATNPNLHGHVVDNDNLLQPVFYVDRQLGDRPTDLVVDLIDGDERFFPPPRMEAADNYNYNDNGILEMAIAAGHRGAFWDILRRLPRG